MVAVFPRTEMERQVYTNARDEYDLFHGRSVSLWSYWRGGGPPAGTSRLELVQERYDFAQRKLERANAVKSKATAMRDAANASYTQAIECYGQAARDYMAYTYVGPKKSDLKDHEDRMLIVARAKKTIVESSEEALDDAGEECFRFRRCVKAARVGLEAATWAEAALTSSPAAHMNGESAVVATLPLDVADDLGVPIALSHLFASVQSEGRGKAWKATPGSSNCFTVDVLSVVLALGGVSRDFRSAVRAWVNAKLTQLDFTEHVQRCEFPREADSHNNIQAPLHYDESVLSYVEAHAHYVTRTLATLDLEACSEYQLRWTASAGSAMLRATWPFRDAELCCEMGGSFAVEPPNLARADRLRRALEDEVHAHAAKRAGRVMPLSLLALAACHPHTARALPLHWPLRLLAAMAKVALRRPRASIDAVAQSFVEVVAPGVTRTQYKTACEHSVRGPREKADPALKAARKAALDDGFTVAMVLRVVHFLLHFHPGHGWAARKENHVLYGDIDLSNFTNAWNFDDPSVIIAAKMIARLKGKHGQPRGHDECVWNKHGDGRADTFEDEVRCNRDLEANYERLGWTNKQQQQNSPAWTMPPADVPSPMPSPLAEPFPVKQNTLAVGSVAHGSSPLIALWKLTPQQTASATATPHKAASPTATPQKAAPATASRPSIGKRRKVVDNRDDFRDGFMRLFHPPKKAARVGEVVAKEREQFEGAWGAETSAAAREARRSNSPSSRR